ncbi:TetR/AcrR family transcriptional regulator [Hyphomonas sp. NPDC076900]|uniref:TetR/AcrR family transcriptional regulator n=1 Tax=unclassified Hyphomonas TaxID=2630699 RepID=UPI003D00D4C3
MNELSAFPTQAELWEMKRNEILRCAARIFSEKGYEGTSLSAIASELGVTKTALYHYVSNKKQLLVDCYRQSMDRALATTNEAETRNVPALDKLKYVLRGYAMMATSGGYQYLWRDVRIVLENDKENFLQAERDEIDRRFRSILKACIDEGSLRKDTDPKLAYLHIIGAVNWMAVWFDPSGPWSAEFASDQMVENVLRGYLAD